MFLHQLVNETRPYSVVIEDDGRVAYAYLLRDGEIIGDVWLYNRCPAPTEPEWKDRDKAPYANSYEYTIDHQLISSYEGLDLRIEWDCNEPDACLARIFVLEEPLALVAPNAKPGWCRNALKDGPLAKRMEPSL